ncbi:MAG: response regulator transcription factor [Prevotellaceae bacterium]|jgi:DNA-binding response OmpR family regulator|nr:response regulator transcription factor [Prevotellaceae bacterium]
MGEKILLVDDDKDICEILAFNLSNEGYHVDYTYSAEDALKKFTPAYSLILLDVMMGGMSGYKMAERLRQDGSSVPIIFLTAKDTENDMITGFSVGGDDYISKPFSIKEVVARVKAVLKRASGIKTNSRRLLFGEVAIDLDTKEVIAGRTAISFTKTEFEILALLATNPSKIFRREDIIDRIWKDAIYTSERTIDVHITRLRKKLGKYAPLISSRSGYGYRFNIPI